MKDNVRRGLITILLSLVLVAVVLRAESPLPVLLRLKLIGFTLATGFTVYASLAWSVIYIINRSAEYLTPQQLVARTIALSAAIAALVGCLSTALMPSVFAVNVTSYDFVLNSGMLVLITASVTAVYSLRTFVERWKALTLMEEGLKRAVLKAEFDSLKNQVNPHFLFNSLNILSALIPEDTRQAVQFVERLSKVFRYSLQHSDQNTVELATELRIAESYLFIHQTRFGPAFRYRIDLQEEEQRRHIVTQGLLTLLENVIKHNECSQEKPLLTEIVAENDYLIVRNTYQPKNRLQVPSSGIGLRNLRNRYAQLSEKPVEVEQTGATYSVKLPLL